MFSAELGARIAAFFPSFEADGIFASDEGVP